MIKVGSIVKVPINLFISHKDEEGNLTVKVTEIYSLGTKNLHITGAVIKPKNWENKNVYFSMDDVIGIDEKEVIKFD